ncbi:hypothetical protein MCUN1_000040 [Malassezia cuniculi]|uniref:Dihydroxyacetone kinase n=1 Tax=Malassezia cuniculi TaxID=948313 RepID=A0AAF0EQL7_9BASI|nr:hypothetical protein MCUN1_000040 [Malassezia cuniculi]
MSTKHVFETSNGLVDKALAGTVALNPALGLYAHHKVVYDKTHDRSKVAILAGGGAGHEPSFAGLVGKGLLTVAVSGEIFASPSAAQISSGVDLAPSDKGLVVVVNRYTGDSLNFGLAAEKARAAYAAEGGKREVAMVIVGDDVSVGRTKGGLVGRRGLTGCPILCKLLGAGAQADLSVKQLEKLGNVFVENTVTVGSSFDHCHVPGRSKDPVERAALADEAVEIGMGIHNEPGVKHIENKPEPSELIAEMLSLLVKQDDADRSFTPFAEGDEPILFVNNLGGMSVLEMNAVVDEVVSQLRKTWKIEPARVYQGTLITSLNAPGFGITLINHKRASQDAGVNVLELIDADTDVAAWPGVLRGWSDKASLKTAEELETESTDIIKKVQETGFSVSGSSLKGKAASSGPVNGDSALVGKVIETMCQAVIDVEPTLTKYDTIVGDGDAGETLRHCGESVLAAFKNNEIPLDRAIATVLGISATVESNMGGTSGALYGLFLAGLVQGLQSSTNDTSEVATIKHWAHAAQVALKSLSNYTPARPGDRTLVDALTPFCETLKSQAESGADAKTALSAAVDAAKDGAEKTRDMTARLGRAVYVGETKEKVPDPGAWGVWALTAGILQNF